VEEVKVIWKGYSDDHDSWEPEEGIIIIMLMTKESVERYKDVRSLP
jgi:hypothetical protein